MIEPKRLPIATLVLIGLAIVAAFWAVLMPEDAARFAFDPVRPTILGALGSLFVHANLIHLLGNMVFLAAVGPAVEFALGTLRYIAVFLTSGLAGVLVHWIFTTGSTNPPVLVGASGAVAGCVAYFSVRYINLRVPVLPKVGAPIWVIALAWIGLQALGAVVRIGDPGGVAFWAHLGGFAAGLVLSLFFKAPKLAQIQFGHDVIDEMNARGPAASLAWAEQHLASHPGDSRALAQLADAHRTLGHGKEETSAILQLLDKGSPEPAPYLERLAALGNLAELTALRRLQFAAQVRDRHQDLARVLLQSVVDMGDEESRKPDALLALAEVNESPDRKSEFAKVVAELQAKYPFHAATEIARAKGWLA